MEPAPKGKKKNLREKKILFQNRKKGAHSCSEKPAKKLGA